MSAILENHSPELLSVSLDDKYEMEAGRVYLNGTQALVRLPMMQRQRDFAQGLNTACFISGYRGSPLGAVDQTLWKARDFVKKNHIHFIPGINEDLAATSLWGSQQAGLFGDGNYDGVFGMFYAKGPGIDRSGDVLRHANLAGTSPHGGVLCLGGDDHTCKSSTTAHQTEHAFIDAMIPVLSPAGVQEFLDLGLHGWAMSRFSGVWVAFKTVADTVDSSASVFVDPTRLETRLPTDFAMPEGGLNIRLGDPPLVMEKRLHQYKLYAALAYARENKLDQEVIGPKERSRRRYGIITTGKSYLDVRQALEDLGITPEIAADIGLSVYKVGMVWPLEPHGIRYFSEGLEEILVVEEKRALIENQLKEQLYNNADLFRPRVIGKFDEKREWVLPSAGELTPARIARVLAARIKHFHDTETVRARLQFLAEKEKQIEAEKSNVARIPYFCSGCPHNRSTVVPDGSRATAGVGCHFMARWMDRNTEIYTHMGGEGASWIGESPFVSTKHIFVNLGDGTYFHSGSLALRAALAANINATYKILFNDAVSMTGGQPHDGDLNPIKIAQQVYAEGVRKIVVVSDEPEKYPKDADFPKIVTRHHRDDLETVQKDLRSYEGVSVLIYDQTCAAEKRRRRKRGKMEDPLIRVAINQAVCEGCGDCSVQSNCVSIIPVETEFGRKRAVDQSSCNKDFSCLNGFCPSFVSLENAQLKKPVPVVDLANQESQAGDSWQALPDPALPSVTDEPYNIVVTGIGGTGVVTIGALIGMAAHLEGKGVSVMDMAGLAQKGGAVVSHIRVAAQPDQIHASRVAAGEAHAVLGCDIVTAASFDCVAKMREGLTQAVINDHETPVGDFIHNPDHQIPTSSLAHIIDRNVGTGRALYMDANKIATTLLGDSIASNLFMLGVAFQKGLIPVSADAIEKAIDLNAVAVDMNKAAFLWGRRAVIDLPAVKALVATQAGETTRKDMVGYSDVPPAQEFATKMERRKQDLVRYQGKGLAKKFEKFVTKAEEAEKALSADLSGYADAVAQSYHHLLAFKDEYEVASLFTDGRFLETLDRQFAPGYKIKIHLAPPTTAKIDPNTGYPAKKAYGPWMLKMMARLKKLRVLRGTPFDPFGRSAERKTERRLIKNYEALIKKLHKGLTKDNHAIAVQLAALPLDIRGYGHVKERSIEKVSVREKQLLDAFQAPPPELPQPVAAE